MRTARGKFNHCQVKELSIERVPDNKNPHNTWKRASLKCPNPSGNGLESNGDYHRAGERAINDLRKVAAAAACGSCTLHSMSKVELLATQTAEVEAEAKLARAQAERLEEVRKYKKLLEAGAEVVDQVNRGALGTEAAEVVTEHPDSHLENVQPPFTEEPPQAIN